MSSTSLFLIVGRSGEPLYELDTSGSKSDDAQHLNQFIAHAALDLVELAAWTTNATALRCIDKFQEKCVSAFLTPGNVKFILLHDGRNEDSIRAFFNEVHELYIKLLLSPFTDYDAPITSTSFDKRVRMLSKRI